MSRALMSEHRSNPPGLALTKWAKHNHVVVVTNLVIAFQIAYFGSNGHFRSMLAATLNLLLAFYVSLVRGPIAVRLSPSWKVPVGLWAAAIAWVTVPDALVQLFGSQAMEAAGFHRVIPDMVFTSFWKLLGTVAAIYVGVSLGFVHGTTSAFVRIFLALGLFINALFVLQIQFDPTELWGQSLTTFGGRYPGTVLNPNTAGTLLGVLALLSFSFAKRAYPSTGLAGAGGSMTSIGYAAITLIALIAAITTGSRTAVSLTIFLIILMAVRSRFANLGKYMALATIAFAVIFFSSDVMNSFGSTSTERFARFDDDLQFRFDMWSYYWKIASANLWSGYGVFSFATVNAASLHSIDSISALWSVNAAHNILIELVMEGGMPYLILSAVGVISVLHAITPSIRAGRDRSIAEGMLASLVLIFGVSLIDIALTVPAIQTLSAIVLGVLWGRVLRQLNRSRPCPRIRKA